MSIVCLNQVANVSLTAAMRLITMHHFVDIGVMRTAGQSRVAEKGYCGGLRSAPPVLLINLFASITPIYLLYLVYRAAFFFLGVSITSKDMKGSDLKLAKGE